MLASVYESGHKSNEYPKRRQVNIVDYEDRDDVEIETELVDSDFIEEHGESTACLVHQFVGPEAFHSSFDDD